MGQCREIIILRKTQIVTGLTIGQNPVVKKTLERLADLCTTQVEHECQTGGIGLKMCIAIRCAKGSRRRCMINDATFWMRCVCIRKYENYLYIVYSTKYQVNTKNIEISH